MQQKAHAWLASGHCALHCAWLACTQTTQVSKLCWPLTAFTMSAMRRVHKAGALKSAASAQLFAQLANVLIECTSLSQADSSLVAMEKSSSESMIKCCRQQGA